MKLSILFLFLFATVALGATDALPDNQDDGGFGFIGLFVLPVVLAFLCIFLFVIGLGIGAAGVMAVCAATLAALGIVSASVFIGVFRRRFSSGLRAFHYQVFAAIALPAGIGALWFFSRLHPFGLHLDGLGIFIIGSISGVSGGLAFAFALDRLAAIACRRLFA